jgi:hypothetical protein
VFGFAGPSRQARTIFGPNSACRIEFVTFVCSPLREMGYRQRSLDLWPLDVERVDFLEPRVPQEEWASIRGHSVVGPEAAGMQAASLL